MFYVIFQKGKEVYLMHRLFMPLLQLQAASYLQLVSPSITKILEGEGSLQAKERRVGY